MILETIITNLTRNLDVIFQQDGKGISSHEKLKDEALKCLDNIIKNAPDLEYRKMIDSENHEILLGYLMSILCQLARHDKSRSIRLQALDVINSLISRLDLIHKVQPPRAERCSIMPLVLALPGVSSALFKLLVSDTKLPRKLVVRSLQTLAKFIAISFTECDHVVTSRMLNDASPKLEDQNLIETCNNLASRIGILIDYITTNCDDLHDEIKYETLDFCLTIVTDTRVELITRTLKPIVRYLAFISSTLDSFGCLSGEVKLKQILLVDGIRMRMQESSGLEDRLDHMALDCIYKLLDELDNHCLSMLTTERQANLAMLCGLLKLLTPDILMIFLEAPNKRDQFMSILKQLVEFSTEQPFLFLTDSPGRTDALESRNEKIYTFQKRFVHLTEKDIIYVSGCCQMLGQHAEWSFLYDVLKNDLVQFESANNLYLTQQVLRGCLERTSDQMKISRFLQQLVEIYRENIQIGCVKINQGILKESYSAQILKTVIAIETVAVLIRAYVKFVQDQDQKIVILKDLICPLLNWCSSDSRAVSEMALNTLMQVGQQYGHESTKSFIEQYTDYIVDSGSKMLENYPMYPEVTEVIAMTFKLSSMDTFYYFKDIYERVFRVLAKYHHTEKSKSLALFLYRTVTTLNDWVDAKDPDERILELAPLDTKEGIKSVLDKLDIDRRIRKLQQDKEKLDQPLEVPIVTEEEVTKQIEEGQIDMQASDEQKVKDDERSERDKKSKPDEILLTERILKHCIGLMSSNHMETKTLAIRTVASGLRLLRNDENTLLPMVHDIWPPLLHRLTDDYSRNLEVNLCAFECLISMAIYSKDFIRRRTLEGVIPRLCVFLETQADHSAGKRDHEPYCMTMAFKCQLKVLAHVGQLAYHTDIAYSNLWRIVKASLCYLEGEQPSSLRAAALTSLKYLISLDADCVWYYAKRCNQIGALPFDLIFEPTS